MAGPLRLLVCDLAGTTIDHGCCAPVAAFAETLAAAGMRLDDATVRGPMGLSKKDHLAALLALPAAREQFRAAHHREPDQDDLQRLYETEFVPRQLSVVRRYCDAVPGWPETLAWVRAQGIRVATTTGYFRAAADVVYAELAARGYGPDLPLCPDDFPAGRPAPWMIHQAMRQFAVYPPAAVVKVGDTIHDIEEGLNAGCWSIGVTATSNDVGCTVGEYAALTPAERETRQAAVAETLAAAGAHAVIDSVADLPLLLPLLAERVAQGERP
ncbi:MAG: phosphonoacetaldehyde hydrolase [Fimbriimonadaceae bacterium]|nr:phosphonoacetaldehyde hydrolase [Fimbriimonadaceae bacterium]